MVSLGLSWESPSRLKGIETFHVFESFAPRVGKVLTEVFRFSGHYFFYGWESPSRLKGIETLDCT